MIEQNMNFDHLVEFAPTVRLKNRLIERRKRIIEQNLDYLRDKRVLDLASNNGRWSYAAAVAGSREVVGVEGLNETVEEARSFISKLDMGDKVKFHIADIYDWLFENQESFDTVLLLGIYYRIMDHNLLLKLIVRCKPDCIIIDSGFVRSFKHFIWIKTEDPNLSLNALPAFSGQESEVVGHISLGLMNQLAWNCGYKCEPIMWDPSEVEDKVAVHDYMAGRRFTLRLTKMEGNHDPDWRNRYYAPLVTLNPRFKFLFEEGKEFLAVDDRCKVGTESLSAKRSNGDNKTKVTLAVDDCCKVGTESLSAKRSNGDNKTKVTDHFFLELQDILPQKIKNIDLPYMQKVNLINSISPDYDHRIEEVGLKRLIVPEEIHCMSRNNPFGDFYCPDLILECFDAVNLNFWNQDCVLDFGCSSGRVVRTLHAFAPKISWYGCDPRESSIIWAGKNLPGIEFFNNNENPPLSGVEDSFFTCVYAISIWSHYSERLAIAWFTEMHRVIKPGGILIFSAHGETSVHHFQHVKKSMSQKESEARIEVIKCDRYHFKPYNQNTSMFDELDNVSDWGLAFTSPKWFESILSKGWDLMKYMPGRLMGNQDIYVFKKR